jgi:hypothetical protein
LPLPPTAISLSSFFCRPEQTCWPEAYWALG